MADGRANIPFFNKTPVQVTQKSPPNTFELSSQTSMFSLQAKTGKTGRTIPTSPRPPMKKLNLEGSPEINKYQSKFHLSPPLAPHAPHQDSYSKHPLSLVAKAQWRQVNPKIAESETYSLEKKFSHEVSSVNAVKVSKNLSKLKNFNSKRSSSKER